MRIYEKQLQYHGCEEGRLLNSKEYQTINKGICIDIYEVVLLTDMNIAFISFRK